MNETPRHGWKFTFGAMRVREDGSPATGWINMVILVLAVTACALCVWVLVQDRQQSPVQVPQAHYQPLPEPSPTVTVVPVTISDANGAAICIIPTGKPRKNIELARVP